MRYLKFICSLTLVVLLISCSSSQKVLSSWVNKEELSDDKKVKGKNARKQNTVVKRNS